MKTNADYKRKQRARDSKKGFERFEMTMGASTKESLAKAAERAGFESLEELVTIVALNLPGLDAEAFAKLTAIPKHTVNVDHIKLPGEPTDD